MLEEKVVRRGEVWWIKSMDTFGHEYGSGRPGVIISGDSGNEKNPTVMIAYTTSEKKPSMPVNVRVMVDKTPNVVLCNAVNTVDKARLVRKICTLTDSEMTRIGGGLAVAQCIPQYQKPNPLVAEPKQEDADLVAMKLEIEMWRRMYEKTMDQLVELRVAAAVAQRTQRVLIVETSEKKPEDSGLIVDDLVSEEVSEIKSGLVEPDLGYEEDTVPEPPKKPEPKKKSKVEWDGIKVNVNTVATAKELADRTGMARHTADEIVRTRKVVGKYEKIDDLLLLDKFGNISMKRYGHMLTVGDEPTEGVPETEKKTVPSKRKHGNQG